jgi:hypothetical protein
VYEMISRGKDIKKACKEGINMFPPEITVGIIGISRTDYTAVSNKEMANYAMVKEV